MPVSGIMRRMGGQWPAIVGRATDYARRIPPDGVSRGRFVVDVLCDVDPRDCDEVVEMLGRRRIVWLSRRRGLVTVYGSRPTEGRWKAQETERRTEAFLSDLAPWAFKALRYAEDKQAAGSSPTIEDGLRAAVGQILRICSRHLSRGLLLHEAREAMWKLFPAALMQAVAYHEPRLHRRSEAEDLEEEAIRPRRAPNGLSVKQKIILAIERAGFEGATRTDISRSVRPYISTQRMNEIVAELEQDRVIVSMTVRSNNVGRPGQRFFTAEIGLPVVGSDGTMNRRFAA
jgi:hypothetical protein